MLERLFKPKTDEEIKKEMQRKRDELIQRAARMNKLIHSTDSGWHDFVYLINDYISACEKRKVATALDSADEKTLQVLKYLDHEVFILKFMKSIPERVMNQLKELEAKDKEKPNGND